ncbi:MAG TPA: tetratricopeptide repeat protein [Candidatus Nitrosotalea sp.]|nr:tetratricopeptide repeat protein [Candidatus Nitrosotalea sp.]
MGRGREFSADENEDSAVNTLYKVGLSHARHGKPKDAIYFFEKVLLVSPKHLQARFNKANALGKLGRYEEAIAEYEVVLKSRPDHKISLLNKGLALHYLRRYEEAAACYQCILSADPKNASALYQMACTRALQGNLSESLGLLEMAIVYDSQFAAKAAIDPDLAILQGDKKFRALIS